MITNIESFLETMSIRINFILVYVLVSALGSCISLVPKTGDSTSGQTSKVLEYADRIYEPSLQTVQFFALSSPETTLQPSLPAVVSLAQSPSLVLNFDVIGEEAPALRAKILHCDRDWKPSPLNEIEYLNVYNEFILQSYQLSFNTRRPYHHFRWELPRLKISGNYLLVIYAEDNPEDYWLSRRLVVFENQVNIQAEVRFSSQVNVREQNQEIRFEVEYPNFAINNPTEEITAVIRQNYRWDNAILDLRPFQVKEFARRLEYHHYNLENNFAGGNEFRRFELRSMRFLGFHIDYLQAQGDTLKAYLSIDQPRAGRPYVLPQIPDQDGLYFIDRYETTDEAQKILEADYVQVYFRLESPASASGPIYVLGAFNDWQPSPAFALKPVPQQNYWQAKVLLKQGVYDYMYVQVEDGKSVAGPIEGDFAQTQNQYEILIYYRALGARYDRVVGYQRFKAGAKFQNR